MNCAAIGLVEQDCPLLAGTLREPTAHLDPDSERALGATLRQISAVCALAVIAHRFSTVRAADLIVVVDGGMVAAAGSHAELLRDNAYYRRLAAADPLTIRA